MKYKKVIYTGNEEFDKEDEERIKKANAKYLGRLGGQATLKKYGAKHFSEAGKKGMEARWNKANKK